MKNNLFRASGVLALLCLAVVSAVAADRRDILLLTSTNDPAGNKVVVFKLNADSTPSLSVVDALPTGGKGGAGGNGGSVQFRGPFGAVVNFGSNNFTRLERDGNSLRMAGVLGLAADCVQPVSVALSETQAFVVGSNCGEGHSWPAGELDGGVVALSDSSAAQIVAGQNWAAVTLKSGSVLQLPLTEDGALSGASSPIALPVNANNTPLGAAFWGNVLGFNPAHSAYSFALVNEAGNVFPILGPQPAYPANAPCWLAKGPGNIWYSGNSPGQAISIFFTDAQGGAFYKSVALPGVPTDVTVSPDRKWLATIFTAGDGSGARIAVFAIDSYGDLSLAAISNPIGVASFNGVAISE